MSEGTRRTPSFLFVAPDGTTHTFYAQTARKAAEYAAAWAEKQGITLERAAEAIVDRDPGDETEDRTQVFPLDGAFLDAFGIGAIEVTPGEPDPVIGGEPYFCGSNYCDDPACQQEHTEAL